MNWTQAVDAMKAGKHVQLASEQNKKTAVEINGTIVFERGMEPCFLAHAWSADEKPVLVFCGSWSKALFVPDDEHTTARDWVVVD